MNLIYRIKPMANESLFFTEMSILWKWPYLQIEIWREKVECVAFRWAIFFYKHYITLKPVMQLHNESWFD